MQLWQAFRAVKMPDFCVQAQDTLPAGTGALNCWMASLPYLGHIATVNFDSLDTQPARSFYQILASHAFRLSGYGPTIVLADKQYRQIPG